MAMASVITQAGITLTGMFSWAGSAVNFMTDTPLVLIFVLMAVAGVGIGVARSFIKGA